METNWQKAIQNFLEASCKPAVLGVGSILRADDSAGIISARYLLRDKKRGLLPDTLRVFIGDTAPENITGEIIRENPDRLIIIDAIDADTNGRDIVFFPYDATDDDFSASTHRMPLKVFCKYINNSIPCSVAVIGIVPVTVRFGAKISNKVRNAARLVANEIAACLSK